MTYENVERETLVTLEVALSKVIKKEKSDQFKKDIEYELKRIREELERR